MLARVPERASPSLVPFAYLVAKILLGTVSAATLRRRPLRHWTSRPEASDVVKRQLGPARTEGYRKASPARAALAVLPHNGKVTVHCKALPHAAVGKAIPMIRESAAWPDERLWLEFLAFTATRSGDLKGAKRSETDTE